MARLIKEVGRNYNTVILPEQLTTVAWASVTGTPTTLSGYGITDAIGGSGTANYIPKFATSTSLGNSVIYENSSNIGINNTNPLHKLHITQAADGNYPTLGTGKGAIFVAGDTNLYGLYVGINTTFGDAWLQAMRNNTATAYNLILQPAGGNVLVNQTTDSGERLQVTGTTRLTGNTLIVGNATVGQISNNSTNASLDITAGGGGYNAWVDFGFYGTFDASIYRVGYYGDDSGKFKINYTGGGPVEEVLSINSSKTTTINYNLVVDTNTLYVDATTDKVGIGTASPSEKLEVNGNIKTSSPSGGTAKPWKLGAAASATGDTQNTKIEVEIDGVLYYLMAFTV